MKIGNELRDRVTGFQGIATGRMEWMNGCVQWFLKPPVDKDGKMVEGQWIDDAQLEFAGVGLAIVAKEQTGGPAAEPMPTRYHG